ncbi:MAG: glycogen debranching protein GlgX [Acidobacteriota bacterium]
MFDVTDSMPPSSLPLGAHWDGHGVDFRIASHHAEAIELQVFDRPTSIHPRRRVSLRREGGGIWHARVDDVTPGTLYAYRVDGPFAPRDGHHFNPAKLVLDPWARAVTGEPVADPALLGCPPHGRPDLDLDGHDTAAFMPKCVVLAPHDETPRPTRPRVAWRDTVLYETHVRGATRLHPDVPEAWRGTYRGLASEPMLDHFRRLGVTTIELMPVHQGAPERHLLIQGRRNYWNYAPIAFFAPCAAYAVDPRSGGQVDEFRAMVDAFHAAGLEIVVDVVYNHTAEGDVGGPVYAFRGIDHRTYYRHDPRWPSQTVDFTGTGNTLDVRQPLVRRLIVESLRYWVDVLGVDGFRFDLAVTVGRDGAGGSFRPHAELFERIRTDPVLADVKWIAEPWDLGPGGYRVGGFAPPWREWNDRFRDTARRFWRGDAGGAVTAELATRLAGSQDLFEDRGPLASINYVISHDGFTLHDWVRYEHRRNLANGEANRDGTAHNLSRNWGAEGPSDDPEIGRRRDLARRNLLTSLVLAQGVPMLAHGDEIGRTQDGNNNPYNQDNELAWTDWSAPDDVFFDFVRRLLVLRRRFPLLRREQFLIGRRQAARRDEPIPDADVLWLGTDGRELDADDWQRADHRAFAMALLPHPDEPGEGLLLLINGSDHRLRFTLPPIVAVGRSTLLLDTAHPHAAETTSEGLADWSLDALSQALFAFRPVVGVRDGG